MARNTGQRQQNGVHDMRENDFVRLWSLDARIHDKVTTHTTYKSDSTLGIRAKKEVTKWKYERQLGSGQTGTVHLESQLEAPHNKRAVKVINKRRGLDIFSELRFLGITSKHDSFFTRLDGWFETDHEYRIPMEYIRHGDLSGHIMDMDEYDAKVIGHQLLKGLKILREENIAHFDLKPGNILVVRTKPRWWVKIADFGISQNVTFGGHSNGVLSGYTPGYEAPEFRSGERSSDPYKIDMWCLGRVLQYILTWIEPGFVNTQISAFNSGKSCLELEELQNKNISADGIHFLDMLLSNEPAQRPEPAEALEDPWICRDLNEAHIALQSARINVEKRNIDTIRWIIDHGNKDMIRLVLDYDMDIDNIPIGDGSPLHYAVTVGNLDAVKYFVELGADLEKRTEPSLSETALHLAVRHGQVQILEYLIQRGANLEALSGSDKTPIASFEKDISKDCIQVLLERKVKFEAKSDVSFDERSVIYPEWIPGATIRKGFTPLHRAAFLGLHDITKLLLEWHADVKAQTQTGETAAHVACENGHVEIVKMLLEFGDILEAKDIYGNTALAVYRDDALPAVEFLLDQGANIEASNDEKFTPLHHASLHRCVGVARLFLHRGADVDPKSEWSSTPLHLATASGASQVVMLLLEHGANVETLDGDGHTPLGCTLEPSSMCVELLLAKGANMYAAQNSRKLSPLHVAVRSNNFKVVELILTKARRNLYESQEKLKRTKSEANQNRAYQNAKKEYEKSKEEFEKIVNGKSKSRKTPLDYATTYKPIDVRIATLLKYHGGTTSIQLVWERSMQRVYESWRICEHCRCTIFGTGWQCDLCSPEARNRHDTRNTYDVCSICAVQGKRCNGEGHYLYLKPPTGPVDRSVSVSPLENGSSRYEASISSIGTQLSTQSEDSFPLYFNPGGDGPSGNGSMQTTLEKSITIRHNHDPQSRITPDHPRVPRGTSRPLLHRNRDSISSLASASSGGSTPLESPTAAGSTNIPFFHEINLPSRDADADPTRRRTSAPSPLLFRVRE